MYNNEIINSLCDDSLNRGFNIIDHGEIIEVEDLKNIEVETAQGMVIHMKDTASK